VGDHFRLPLHGTSHLFLAEFNTGNHGIGGEDDLRQEIASEISQSADLFHTGNQTAVDDREGVTAA
jgi:hypothetical protein